MRSLLLLLIATSAFASDPYPKNANVRVSHYKFKLELNDTTDIIYGEATVSIRFLKATPSVDLNLIGKDGGPKGMTVSAVKTSGKPVIWAYDRNLISIQTTDIKAGEEISYTVIYKGIPADGLIISKNKFGDRTFFGDNWPDRGRHWLPTIDHPSYKSTVEFIITAPQQYDVVATGKLIEESAIDKGRKLTHWSGGVPVSVKVMTIGVARFAVSLSGEIGNVPVTTWVYPQNREWGFNDFALAPRVLEYFQSYVGPYPFEKLAHVQSKTKFGGLENAGNIFYFENSVTGENEHEELIAHETAHQWFGNSATEDDWHHVWLSEGFATYLTALYMEHTYGRDKLENVMRDKRKAVLDFAKKNSAPIVDTTIVDINKVLSTNTYQKASWVLHMLRKQIGDQNFHKGIRDYYNTYKGGNALTADFKRIMEKNSEQDLSGFFQRWIYTGGHPKITGTWSYDAKTKRPVLDLELTTNGEASLPLDVVVHEEGGGQSTHFVQLKPGKQTLRLAPTGKPVSVELDPDVWLLFEGAVSKK
jgi:aminopeptidase N